MKGLRNLLAAFKFFFYYLGELVHSNLKIARDVLRPGLHIQPGFIRIALKARSDAEILAFANLVTMTPGTLSLDVSEDRRTLTVHAMYLQDAQSVRESLGEHLQSQVLEILR
jgi:multicomponent Na+:H+ antiporter subunit E